MPIMTSYPAGTPSWVDLGAPDPEAAAAFYGELFGWDIQEGPPEAGGYRMCMLEGQPVAGLGPQMSPDQPTFWSTYVSVDDADKTAALVSEAGGQRLVAPMDVMNFGRMAVFLDAEGAAISIWQPRDMKGAGLVNEPGAFCWNDLGTRDPATAKAFYQRVFGWEAKPEPMGASPYEIFNLGDRGVAGLVVLDESAPPDVPPHWNVVFAVEDCDASAAKISELGGSIIVAPADIPVGRFAVATDVGGASFGIIKLAG
jgi:hypothetical protein